MARRNEREAEASTGFRMGMQRGVCNVNLNTHVLHKAHIYTAYRASRAEQSRAEGRRALEMPVPLQDRRYVRAVELRDCERWCSCPPGWQARTQHRALMPSFPRAFEPLDVWVFERAVPSNSNASYGQPDNAAMCINCIMTQKVTYNTSRSIAVRGLFYFYFYFYYFYFYFYFYIAPRYAYKYV